MRECSELALELFFPKEVLRQDFPVGESGYSRYRIDKCMEDIFHEAEWYHGIKPFRLCLKKDSEDEGLFWLAKAPRTGKRELYGCWCKAGTREKDRRIFYHGSTL